MQIAVRLAVTEDDTTTHADLLLTGSRGQVRSGGRTTYFPSSSLWQVVRELLPDRAHLRADPMRSRARDEVAATAQDADVAVVVATSAHLADGAETPVVLRTWAADDEQLYVVEPGFVRTASAGALADLLVWDVAGAMEAQVRSLEAAS